MKDNQKQAIMESIRANPDDDVLRLKYADYLEEHPKRSKNVIEKRQAEFIRSQSENPGVLPSNVAAVNNAYTKRDLKTSWGQMPSRDWIEYEGNWLTTPLRDRPANQSYFDAYNLVEKDYQNGLLVQGRFSINTWLEQFGKVLTYNPIQYIHVHDMIPYWGDEPKDFHWTVQKNLDIDSRSDRFYMHDNCIDIPGSLVENCYEREFAHLKMRRPLGRPVYLDDECQTLSFETQEDAYAWLSMKLIQYGLKRLGLGKKPA